MSSTLDDFFADWTEESAKEHIDWRREELEKVEAALAADDWKVLGELGYLTVSYSDNPDVGPEEEGAELTVESFNQWKYDSLKETVDSTPEKLARRMNNALNL